MGAARGAAILMAFERSATARGPAVELKLPPLPPEPRCTLVIPCVDEEGSIEAVIRAAMEQRYPRDKIEIFVCDGGSKDGTRAVVERLAALDARVRLLDNPGRFPGAAVNEALRHATGSVIIRLDAHAAYALDFVAASVDALRATGAANAGGAARPLGRSRYQRFVCAALASPLGVGGSAYRDAGREGFVESVWGGAFRREALEHVGGFDAGARANEDAELNQRLWEAGGKVYLSRAIVAHYYPRPSPSALGRQYFTYGRGRARTLRRRRRLLSIRPLIPFAFVTGLGALGLLGAVSSTARAAAFTLAAVYSAALLAESARLALRVGPTALGLPLVLPVMHGAHGLGVWAGIADAARARLGGR